MATLTSATFTALPRRSRRAGRCVCAAAVPPAVAAPTQLVAPAPARSTANWPELSVSAPSPLWTVADAAVAVAPAPAAAAPATTESGLPEGGSWRYSEFINAVQRGKVERVRFAKDGSALQLTAVDGCVARRAPSAVVPGATLRFTAAGPPRALPFCPLLTQLLPSFLLPGGAPPWCCPTTRTWWTSWPRTVWTSPSARATPRATPSRCWATSSSPSSPSAVSSSCFSGRRRVQAHTRWFTPSANPRLATPDALGTPARAASACVEPQLRSWRHCLRCGDVATQPGPRRASRHHTDRHRLTCAFFSSQQNGGGGAGGGPMGGMGGMGGPMDFGKSKSKFQEVPETGVKFADVAVRFCCFLLPLPACLTHHPHLHPPTYTGC